jgi:hypothetical protein
VGGPSTIQAHVLQIFCFPMACKDSPDPIAGTGLAGDAAANFKCLPLLCAGVLFGLGAGAHASRDGAWLDLSFFFETVLDSWPFVLSHRMLLENFR